MNAHTSHSDVESAMRAALADYATARGRPSTHRAREFLDDFTDWLRTTRRPLYERALACSIGAHWLLEHAEFIDEPDDASATDADDSTDGSTEDERYSSVVAAFDEFVQSSCVYVPRKVGARVSVIGSFRRWLRENDVALLASIGDDDYLVHWAVAAFEHEE